MTVLKTYSIANLIIEKIKGIGKQEIFYKVNGKKVAANKFWNLGIKFEKKIEAKFLDLIQTIYLN